MSNTISPPANSAKFNYVFSLAIIGSLYFIFGFVTWLNGILIPYLKIACELSNFQALFVAFAFYISYTLMALPSSWVLKKTGFKNGMMAQFPVNYAVILSKEGPYIPTLRWLRSSEGVNDFRYIYTLSKKVENAANKTAPEVIAAARYLESIKSFAFGNDNGDVREAETVGEETLKKYGGEKLDKMREKLAALIIAIDNMK